jgi:deoxyribonuclease V
LSFREIPPVVQAIKKLSCVPDVFLVDGQGLMHPFRCGFASHLGIVLNRPTIGVAKSRLIGEAECTNAEAECVAMRYKGEVVGAAVTTRKGCKPVYVSVGHMISLSRAIEVVKHCARGCRVPKPVLEAHGLAAQEKRKINNGIDPKR